jgi:hypothetical protein
MFGFARPAAAQSDAEYGSALGPDWGLAGSPHRSGVSNLSADWSNTTALHAEAAGASVRPGSGGRGIDLGSYARSVANPGAPLGGNAQAGATFSTRFFYYPTDPDETHEFPQPTEIRMRLRIHGDFMTTLGGTAYMHAGARDWSGNELGTMFAFSEGGTVTGLRDRDASGAWSGSYDFLFSVPIDAEGVSVYLGSQAIAANGGRAESNFQNTGQLEVLAPAGYTVEFASGQSFVGSSASVPEPSSALLLLPGLLGLRVFRKRRGLRAG